MTLTILSENSPHPKNPGLKAEHGLAVHVALDGYSILYDFGPEGTLLPNSKILGINLETVNLGILSHGHYDHAGDLEAFLQLNGEAMVNHGRDAFSPRWSISKGSPRDVGIPMKMDGEFADRLSVVEGLDDRDDFVILPAAPGHCARPTGNAFLLAGPEGERLQDDFIDELTLVIRGKKGLVVITGCSHRGILNILDQVKIYCPKCPVSALIGGFHLVDKEESEENLRKIAGQLAASLPESRIYSGHCTENKAIEILTETFGDRYENMYTGKVMTF